MFYKLKKSMEHLIGTVNLYSKLPYGPDENKLKNLLLQCLEHHYGSISECVQKTGWAEDAIKEIKQIIDGVSNKI